MADEAGQIRNEELDAQAEARRRVALAQIRQYGDAVLRMRAGEVEAFDDDLDRLVARMRRLMLDANGVGLAANQVGIVQRVLVFRPAPDEPVTALVNPRLVDRGGASVTDEEGCLSLVGVLVPVERETRVTVEGQDADGSPVRRELDELAARVVQHEIDHLDGVLILDRTTAESRRAALATLRPRLLLSG